MQVFRVRKPGFFSTIQDLGRTKTRRFGLSTSGAVDKYALQVGNGLVGNELGAAAIEMTLVGLELEVLADCRIAITGADLGFALNGRLVQPWLACNVSAGDVLTFTGGDSGCRAYLSVAGGFDAPSVFGSRSTDTVITIGGIEGRPFRAGDILEAGDPTIAKNRILATAGSDTAGRRSRWLDPDTAAYISSPAVIRVVPGPQASHFTAHAWDTFLSSEYEVGLDSNRVGVRFDGPAIETQDGADILSEAVPEGAIQVPAGGRPIALLADRRTVGGYAKIGTAITVDIPKLAQLRPGDRVSFRLVNLETAQRLLSQQSAWWTRIRQCW